LSCNAAEINGYREWLVIAFRLTEMNYKIGIHPDNFRHANGEEQSFSGRWIELAAQSNIAVQIVDAYAPDALLKIRECDAFMWRFDYVPPSLTFAKRLLPAIEQGLQIPVFPSWKSAWHFEDKIGQHYLLAAAGIPMPQTWVFWHLDDALEFCRQADYPLVMKLAHGFRSANVVRIRNRAEASRWARKMFRRGVRSIQSSASSFPRKMVRKLHDGMSSLLGRSRENHLAELEGGYLLLQEFIDGNNFDTRVTIIGNRAFAFRRFNRPNDFRASGSGRGDWDPAQIDLAAVRLAFEVARQLDVESVAVDVLRREGEQVIVEISYTFASWAVRDCPGHWVLRDNPATGKIDWIPGQLAAEDAIFIDFTAELSSGTRVLDQSPKHDCSIGSIVGNRLLGDLRVPKSEAV
jgi:glutathione synthase/RimK-type ligase-like ATP-grasp enzyme